MTKEDILNLISGQQLELPDGSTVKVITTYRTQGMVELEYIKMVYHLGEIVDSPFFPAKKGQRVTPPDPPMINALQEDGEELTPEEKTTLQAESPDSKQDPQYPDKPDDPTPPPIPDPPKKADPDNKIIRGRPELRKEGVGLWDMNKKTTVVCDWRNLLNAQLK